MQPPKQGLCHSYLSSIYYHRHADDQEFNCLQVSRSVLPCLALPQCVWDEGDPGTNLPNYGDDGRIRNIIKYEPTNGTRNSMQMIRNWWRRDSSSIRFRVSRFLLLDNKLGISGFNNKRIKKLVLAFQKKCLLFEELQAFLLMHHFSFAYHRKVRKHQIKTS